VEGRGFGPAAGLPPGAVSQANVNSIACPAVSANHFSNSDPRSARTFWISASLNSGGAKLLNSSTVHSVPEPRSESNNPTMRPTSFVAFTGEQKGLVGSQACVKQLRAGRESVSAMVNMDTLGLGETEAWFSHADPQLARLLESAAQSVNLPVTEMNADNWGSTDSEPFRDRKIPAITIHSVTQSTLSVLHSRIDKIDIVNRDAYYRTYLLVLSYLAVLDRKLADSTR
jgi:hypothetical protein